MVFYFYEVQKSGQIPFASERSTGPLVCDPNEVINDCKLFSPTAEEALSVKIKVLNTNKHH